MADIARFPVYVDEEAFAEDREHASAAGREMADREPFERDGIAPGELRPCEPEAWRHAAERLREDLPTTARRALGDGLPGAHFAHGTSRSETHFRASTFTIVIEVRGVMLRPGTTRGPGTPMTAQAQA